jgi:hypothetical protein
MASRQGVFPPVSAALHLLYTLPGCHALLWADQFDVLSKWISTLGAREALDDGP